ncbi:hypothetical protein [Leptolyngbya ohadii]|uniref:hypothetical protein n=1 Tax=Leptolyngbya ohadii TaxID=1962290 RepID=UPI000B598AC8|nr:hypothetical protein [Leptolyngbya ohadii]
MQYAQVLATVAQSAWSTLCILDRQGRKDARKVARFATQVYSLLSSPAACKRYAIAAQIIADVAVILWMIAKASKASLDEFVESCEAVVDTQPEIPALPAAKPRAEHSIVPFCRRPAAPTDAELVKWAKANRSLLSGLKVGKWSYSRRLRESERQAVLAAMTAQKTA